MNDQRVTWGLDGFASESGWAFAHCINQSTCELICSQDVWVSVGTGLPAGAFLDEPPQPVAGKAIIRQGGAWTLVDDLRGTTAYNKQTRQSEVISALAPLPSELTLIAPISQFDAWNEESGSWVKDDQAEQQWLTQSAISKRSSLLAEAGNEIAALMDAIDPDINPEPTDSAKDKLIEWKKYRAAIAVIDCSSHPIQWPQKPQ